MKNFNYLNFKKHPTFIVLIFAALAMLAILPARAMGMDYVIANQLTLIWEATAPVKDGESIEYAIYQAPADDKNAAVKLWQGPQLEYTVTFSEEDLWIFGIETIRIVTIDGTPTAVSNSAIGWSDDPVVAPNPFGVRYYAPPPITTGFRPK